MAIMDNYGLTKYNITTDKNVINVKQCFEKFIRDDNL